MRGITANGLTKTVQSLAILETSYASSGHGKELSVTTTMCEALGRRVFLADDQLTLLLTFSGGI